jgi:hypothetical protein
MIADTFYLAFAGLDLCHAACRLMISSGFDAGMFGLRLRIWPRSRSWSRLWPRSGARSRNHQASIKNP